MWNGSTPGIVKRLMAERLTFSTREVALAAGVSRQAAQKYLRTLVSQGRLTIQGKARAALYRRVDDSKVVDSAPVDDGFRRAAQLFDLGNPYLALP